MKKVTGYFLAAMLITACRPLATTTFSQDTATVSPTVPPFTDTLSPTFIPEFTNTPQVTPPPNCREIILEPNEAIHAVHMGGNWGTTYEPENNLPSEYFDYLRDLNVNLVGISVALHYNDSLDSTVERRYFGVGIPTFSDEFLREMIRKYHQYGICVYMTLAFEAHEAEKATHPVSRWELGEPTLLWPNERILPEFWPWAIDHPDHERFVTEFWRTYTDQAVHFGQLAEEEGVALYSLGTETEGLFRTHQTNGWPNDFSKELRAMVIAVREVYHGPLTYDMHYSVFTESETLGPGSDHLWEDLDLDVIGLSSYFELSISPPTIVTSIGTLEELWETIFQDNLIPLQEANPNRPIYFTEFGYVDSTRSLYQANIDELACRSFSDGDGNNLDDGEETQANIYQALFNVMDKHPGVLNGTFLWGMMMADDKRWAEYFAKTREFSIRNKLAEDVVRNFYSAEPRTTRASLYIKAPTPFPIEESTVIYDDALGEGWELWQWEAEVDKNIQSVTHSGLRALGVTPGVWGSVGFFNPMDISKYAYLEFYVNGGTQGGQNLSVTLWDNQNERELWMIRLCNFLTASLPSGEWIAVRISLQHLDLKDKEVSIGIQNPNDRPASQFFIDDVRLVAEGKLTTPMPTSTPFPTPDTIQWERDYVIYNDKLSSGWSLDPWGGQVDANSTELIYTGSQAIEISLRPGIGITFDTSPPFDISGYTFLVFYLNGYKTADQRLYVEMKSGDNIPLGERAYLTYSRFVEGYPLQPGQWRLVVVPLSVINPESIPFAWFDIGDASGSGASTFYVDDIRLVGAEP